MRTSNRTCGPRPITRDVLLFDTLVDAGGLMAYDINYPGLQRAPPPSHRILKGAKPSDLPVQQPRDRVLSPRAADPRVSRRSAKGSRGAVMGFDSIALS